MLEIQNSKAYFNLSQCVMNCTFLFEVDKMNIYQKYNLVVTTRHPRIRLPLIWTNQMNINHD